MTTQLAPDRLALPPPLDLDLVDAGRTTGWIADNAVGFRGFGDATEAVHAAWVAHRTLARRLARTHGGRPVPVDTEPLELQRVDGKEMILASGRPIANLIRPGPGSRSGVDSFGFELSIPTPITELQVRAKAYLMYRTLRKSGIRWAMWRPERTPRIDAKTNPVADRPSTTTRTLAAVLGGRIWPRLTRVARAVLPLSAVAVLFAGVAQLVTTPLTAALLAGMGAGGVMLFRSRRLR
jgi:hypothetical protein